MHLVQNRCSGVLFMAKVIIVLRYEAYLIISRTVIRRCILIVLLVSYIHVHVHIVYKTVKVIHSVFTMLFYIRSLKFSMVSSLIFISAKL